jgi:hypothetical protein
MFLRFLDTRQNSDSSNREAVPEKTRGMSSDLHKQELLYPSKLPRLYFAQYTLCLIK